MVTLELITYHSIGTEFFLNGHSVLVLSTLDFCVKMEDPWLGGGAVLRYRESPVCIHCTKSRKADREGCRGPCCFRFFLTWVIGVFISCSQCSRMHLTLGKKLLV